MKQWPSIRESPRFRLDAGIALSSQKTGTVRGWCHDISEGGLSASIPCVISADDEVTLEVRLSANRDPLIVSARVRYGRGSKYGFEFLSLTPAVRSRINDYGRNQQTTAYILSANSTLVWVLYRTLQQLGVSQVRIGSPKTLTQAVPKIIVVDSDWPDFAEVIEFLRSECNLGPLAMIAVLSPNCNAADANRSGADMVLHKPLSLERTRKLFELAYRLVTRTQEQEYRASASSSATSAAMRLLGAS